MSKGAATWAGFVAILLWGVLALLTVGAAPTPPFLLNAICFGIGGTQGGAGALLPAQPDCHACRRAPRTG
ncbi:MAG: EamA family transporter, partial [Pseudomonadota bacterium]